MNAAGRVPQLLDAVGEDSDLTPEEKETTLRFAKRDDTARIFTAEAALTRRAIAHPEATVKHLDVLQNDGTRRSPTVDEYEEGKIVGVMADLPIGVLSVKRDPRRNNNHAPVIAGSVLDGVRE